MHPYYHIQQYYKLHKNTRERLYKLEHIIGSECIPKDVIEKQQGHIEQEQKKQNKADYIKVEQRRFRFRTILSQPCRNQITRSRRHLRDGPHDVVDLS